MEYKYYGIDKRFFNKICTVLKYMSLESPLARAGFLKDNYFSCENAFNLLNTLITQTEWITRENENREKGLLEGDLMCKLSLDDCELLTYIIKNYDEEVFAKEIQKCNSRTIHNFESNYQGGYFGEIYDRINIKCCGTEWKNKNEKNKNELEILNFILKRCIFIERHKSYFVRNLFVVCRYELLDISKMSFIKRRRYLKKHLFISLNEQKFLFYFFDYLHNIPEYIDKLLNLINKKNEDKSFFVTFESELTELYGLLRQIPEYNFNLKFSPEILRWKLELQTLSDHVFETCELIKQLKNNKYI